MALSTPDGSRYKNFGLDKTPVFASNLVFHEQTKKIDKYCHFVHEKIQLGLIFPGYVKIRERLGDIFTKSLSGD